MVAQLYRSPMAIAPRRSPMDIARKDIVVLTTPDEIPESVEDKRQVPKGSAGRLSPMDTDYENEADLELPGDITEESLATEGEEPEPIEQVDEEDTAEQGAAPEDKTKEKRRSRKKK